MNLDPEALCLDHDMHPIDCAGLEHHAKDEQRSNRERQAGA